MRPLPIRGADFARHFFLLAPGFRHIIKTKSKNNEIVSASCPCARYALHHTHALKDSKKRRKLFNSSFCSLLPLFDVLPFQKFVVCVVRLRWWFHLTTASPNTITLTLLVVHGKRLPSSPASSFPHACVNNMCNNAVPYYQHLNATTELITSSWTDRQKKKKIETFFLLATWWCQFFFATFQSS